MGFGVRAMRKTLHGYNGGEERDMRFPKPRRKRCAMKYVCPCGYEYDPEVGDPDAGIAPGTAFEDIPDDWVCPWCGLGKDAFEPAE